MSLFHDPQQRLTSVSGELREILKRCQSGDVHDSCVAFAELLHRLLRLTVLDEKSARFPPLIKLGDQFVVGKPEELLPLNNGWFLQLLYSFKVEPSQSAGGVPKLKTLSSSVQAQRGRDPSSWVFRYDYLRYSKNPHPPGHLQIAGDLHVGDALPARTLLERIHFPTGRVTLEAIIRLLIVQFGVQPNEPAIWSPLLHLSETEFLKIARHLPSGPDS